MLEKGSTLLISDVGCAALLCRAAMESAAMNVYVNTRLLRDRGRATEIEARAETLTAGCSARAESIALSVKNRLKGGSMAEVLRGAPAAEALCEALSPRVRVLRDRGTAPTLAIVRVGARPDGVAYESSILNRCAKVGIEVQRCVLPEDCVRARLPEEIRRIKENPLVHGCLMIRPLGNLALEQEARALLAPEKDVDGMTPLSLAAVFIGNGPGYPPCTAHA